MRQKKKYTWVAWLPVIVMLTWWLCVGPKAATYYVSKTGSSGASGLSWAFAGSGDSLWIASHVTGGDTVFFGPGEYVGLYITPPAGATSTDRTCYACGDGATLNKVNDPGIDWLATRGANYTHLQHDSSLRYVAKACTLSGATIYPPGTSWVNHSGSIYKTYAPLPQWPFWTGANEVACHTVLQDTLLLEPTTAISSMIQGSQYWDLITESLYVWCSDNSNPNTHEIWASRRPTFDFRSTGTNNFTSIVGFDIRCSEFAGVHIGGTSGSTIGGPDSIFVDHCTIHKIGTKQSSNSGCIGFVFIISAATAGGINNTYAYDGKYSRMRSCLGKEMEEPPDGDDLRCALATLYSTSHFTVESCLAVGIDGVDWKNQAQGGRSYGNTMKFSTIINAPGNAYENLVGHHWDDSCIFNLFIWDQAAEVNDGQKAIWFERSTGLWSGRHVVANNTIVNPLEGLVTSIFDDQDTCNNLFVRNLVVDVRERSQYHGYSGNVTCNDTTFRIDSNRYYGCNAAHFSYFTDVATHTLAYRTFAQWQAIASGTSCFGSGQYHDMNSTNNVDPGFTAIYSYDDSRPSSTQECNLTLSGKTTTRFGRWQPATSTPTSTYRRVKGVKRP